MIITFKASLNHAREITTLFVKFISNPYLIGTVVVAVLGAIGVTIDPTTKGISDSARAMTYDKPSVSPLDGGEY